MNNIVILISGGGSNMATIVRTAQQEHWEQRYGARVAAVISNKPDAAGLVFAREQGIAICGKPASGYFMPETPQELMETCRFLEARALGSLRKLAVMRNVALPVLMGQLLLNKG